MKHYNVECAKEIVAQFTMDTDACNAKFKFVSDLIDWIRSEHPEFKDCPADWKYSGRYTVVLFFSIGEPVIVEN